LTPRRSKRHNDCAAITGFRYVRAMEGTAFKRYQDADFPRQSCKPA
jgi:hypothetical protein